MTILHYIPDIDAASGGTSTYMQVLADALGRVCDLHVVTRKSQGELPLVCCNVHYLPQRWVATYRGRTAMATLIDALKPDVVHLNGCWMPGCAIEEMMAQQRHIPTVYTPHGMLEPYIIRCHYWTRKLPAILLYQRRATRRASRLIATSEAERAHLVALGWNRRISLVPQGIDIRQAAVKSTWKRSNSLLFLGRLHEIKGLDMLLQAMAMLRDELHDYQLIIAGDGEADYVRSLRRQAEQLGVASRVNFVGSVSGDAKWSLLRSSDVLVLPSRSENFGYVVVEALACGTPVITTNGTPWTELNTHHCGWQVETEAEALADGLRRFLTTNDAELQHMGERGRRLVEEKYTSTQSARQMMQIYKELKQ